MKPDLSDHPDLPPHLRAEAERYPGELTGERFVYINTRLPWLKHHARAQEEDRRRYKRQMEEAHAQ